MAKKCPQGVICFEKRRIFIVIIDNNFKYIFVTYCVVFNEGSSLFEFVSSCLLGVFVFFEYIYECLSY